ncbi:ParB/RepB/Spo0J family partition protein [Streptomyces chilikensis]|uniref:ParB/RepB/Spo0J family partition protein n=1 Tax=Streptomyces chilikensis TaxID=1194079 RepID=A0ABV3ERD2_9ACTN
MAGAKVDEVPGQSEPLLISVPLDKLHCTRFNPRRNFGTEEELREFGEKLKREQLQPAVVVSRAAYLKLWPEEADAVGTATYVIVNGERRYRASSLIGRPVLEVVQREDVAASRATFLDAIQSENNDRQDLDPIERALGIQTMVEELGSADAVAAYYGKTKGWVSQQRKLLKLTPALQELVSRGEMAPRVGRDIAGLPAEEQEAAWEALKEERAAAKARPKSPPTAPEAPQRFTAVNQEPPATAISERLKPAATATSTAETEPRFTAVNQEQPSAAVNSSVPAASPVVLVAEPLERPTPVLASAAPASETAVPEPRQQEPVPASVGLPVTPAAPEPVEVPVPAGKPLPYDQPFFVAAHLERKMQPEHLHELVRCLLRQVGKSAPEQRAEILQEFGVAAADIES